MDIYVVQKKLHLIHLGQKSNIKIMLQALKTRFPGTGKQHTF